MPFVPLDIILSDINNAFLINVQKKSVTSTPRSPHTSPDTSSLLVLLASPVFVFASFGDTNESHVFLLQYEIMTVCAWRRFNIPKKRSTWSSCWQCCFNRFFVLIWLESTEVKHLTVCSSGTTQAKPLQTFWSSCWFGTVNRLDRTCKQSGLDVRQYLRYVCSFYVLKAI